VIDAPSAPTRRTGTHRVTTSDKEELLRLQVLGVIEPVVVRGRLRWRTTGITEASVRIVMRDR
jgi:hypothetical protein